MRRCTVPVSATDSITLAFEHTKRQLFKPFRFGQSVRLAFVGLLAGELGSGGNLNPSSHGTQPAAIPQLGEIYHKIDPAILATVITVLVFTRIVLRAETAYISSATR